MYEKVTKNIFWIYIDKSHTMNDQYIDLFEKYLNNQLSDAEKKALEQDLQTDETLRQEFDAFKTLQAGIRLHAMQKKLKMLKNLDTPIVEDDKQSPSIKKTKYWIISLMLLGLISLFIYYFSKNNAASNQPEIESHNNSQSIDNDQIQKESVDTLMQKTDLPFVPKKDSVDNKSVKPFIKRPEVVADASKKNLWQKAMSIYQRPESFAMILRDYSDANQDDYKKAVTLFTAQKYNDVIRQLKDVKDEKSQYLVAHAYFLSGNLEQAAYIFRPMAADDFSLFYDDAKWYLSLCLVAQYPESKNELTSIIDDLQKTEKYANQVSKIKDVIK